MAYYSTPYFGYYNGIITDLKEYINSLKKGILMIGKKIIMKLLKLKIGENF